MRTPLYLNTRAASQRFGIPMRTLALWREKKRGPVYYRAGKLVLYKAEDIEKFIKAGAVRPEGAARQFFK